MDSEAVLTVSRQISRLLPSLATEHQGEFLSNYNHAEFLLTFGVQCSLCLGVRVKVFDSRILPHVTHCRCERTAWYSMFSWTVCALLGRVAVTARSVPFMLLGNSEETPDNVSPGYTP